MSDQEEYISRPEGAADDETGEVVDYDDRGDDYYDNNIENNNAQEFDHEGPDGKISQHGLDIKRRSDGRVGIVVNGIIPNVLFISRFGRGTTKHDVEELMRKYGPTSDITVRDNIAFVDFVNDADAEKAKNELHYHPGLNSDSLIVDFKKDKPMSRGPGRGRGRDKRGGESHHMHNARRDLMPHERFRERSRDRNEYITDNRRGSGGGADYGRGVGDRFATHPHIASQPHYGVNTVPYDSRDDPRAIRPSRGIIERHDSRDRGEHVRRGSREMLALAPGYGASRGDPRDLDPIHSRGGYDARDPSRGYENARYPTSDRGRVERGYPYAHPNEYSNAIRGGEPIGRGGDRGGGGGKESIDYHSPRGLDSRGGGGGAGRDFSREYAVNAGAMYEADRYVGAGGGGRGGEPVYGNRGAGGRDDRGHRDAARGAGGGGPIERTSMNDQSRNVAAPNSSSNADYPPVERSRGGAAGGASDRNYGSRPSLSSASEQFSHYQPNQEYYVPEDRYGGKKSAKY